MNRSLIPARPFSDGYNEIVRRGGSPDMLMDFGIIRLKTGQVYQNNEPRNTVNQVVGADYLKIRIITLHRYGNISGADTAARRAVIIIIRLFLLLRVFIAYTFSTKHFHIIHMWEKYRIIDKH